VESNVHTRGPVFFRGEPDYKALLKNCLAGTPDQTIGTVTESGLRGYGGAAFRNRAEMATVSGRAGRREARHLQRR